MTPTKHIRRRRLVWRTLPVLCAAWVAGVPRASGDAPVAVLSEPGFPYYIAPSWLTPEFVRHCLDSVGIRSEFVNAEQLADPNAFGAARFKLLAYVYGNTFPAEALDNLRRFHAHGGCIVAFGGVPFCHPCVREDGKWADKIDEMGWEFVSHDRMGTGLWGQAENVDALAHAAGDPIRLGWMPLPPPPPGVVQFPRLGVTLDESRAMGFDHLLGLPPADEVTPVISAMKAGAPVGHPVCIIRHRCPEFRGAIDIWAGTTLSVSLTMQQQEQLVIASCAYVLEQTGALAQADRAKMLAAARARFVAPMTRAPKREGPFIMRAPPPAKRLTVLDAMGLNPEEELLALTLQGIVNRGQPRVYLIGQFEDRKWLKLLADEGCEPVECDSLDALVKAYRGELAGAVLYDPGEPHTVNLATTIAGLTGAVIATPDLAARYDLKTVEDVRGLFADPVAGYEWVLSKYWPHLDHRAIACLSPRAAAPRDYLVQHRVFTFWLDAETRHEVPPGQVLFFERLLARMPPHGMVLGWWQEGDEGGIGEWRGVDVSSQYAKITVCTVGAYNLSVHSGARLPKALTQKRIRFGSLDRKVYVAFIVSDGDNFGMNLYGVIGRLWEEGMRGKVPIGWGICPTQVELTPDVVRYFYDTATENDLFVCMDGLGYVYPDQYGSALGDAPARYKEFLRQTEPYMRRLDQDHLWFLGGSSRAEQMADALPLDGLFAEYGVPPEQKQTLLANRTAAFWVDVNPWEKPYDDVATYVRRIRDRTRPGRPAFLFVGTNGFCVGPNEVAAILRELGPEYVAVRPDELCHLYREYVTSGLPPNPEPRPALDLSPPPAPGPRVTEDGVLVVREDDDAPDIGGWYTDPRGTQWVRKRLQVPLPAGAVEATVHAMVRGQRGARVTFLVNGHEHVVRLESSAWQWVAATAPATELRTGENEIWYTGNPDGRLYTAGDASSDLGHSDYGAPEHWASLAGELMCYVEVR